MFIVRDFFLNPAKETLAQLWDRSLAAYQAHPRLFAAPLLHLKASGPVRDRLERNFAALAAYLSINRQVPIPRAGLPPIASADTLRLIGELLAGVPRSLPLQWLMVTLPWAPEVAPEIPADSRGYPQPGQDLSPYLCGVKISRKVNQNWLAATLPLVESGGARPDPPEELLALVTGIAPTRWTEDRILLNELETRHSREVERAYDDIESGGRHYVTTRRTHSIPVDGDEPIRGFHPGFRKAVVPLGFEYRKDLSEARYHVARKATAAGNILELILDVGGFGPPWSPSVDLRLHVLGLRALTLPLVPQERILGTRQWAIACEQLTRLLRTVQSDWLPGVESQLGTSPPWFKVFGNITAVHSHPPSAV